MILTGQKICHERSLGRITIRPFDASCVNPNSYNYHLGKKIKVFRSFDGYRARFKTITIPTSGYVLRPGRMYLGTTEEVIGSSHYAMSLIGRSSMGRYGLFLQFSANLGHTTSCHHWTLEIFAALPIRVYPGMIIGQVSFWSNFGRALRYVGRYARINHPQESFTPLAFRS